MHICVTIDHDDKFFPNASDTSSHHSIPVSFPIMFRTCTGHDFIMHTIQDSLRVAPYLGAQAGMFALRERRQHVTQEDFEMAVSKVMKCLVNERTN